MQPRKGGRSTLISTAPCPRKSAALWKGSSSALRTHPAQCLWPCPAVPSASEHVQLSASGKPGITPKRQWHPNGIPMACLGRTQYGHLYFSGWRARRKGKNGKENHQGEGVKEGKDTFTRYSIFMNLNHPFVLVTPGPNLCSCISQLLAHSDPALGSCQSFLNTVCLHIQLDEHADGFNLNI